MAEELNPNGGVVEGADNGSPTTDAPEERQPEIDFSKIDLDQLPQFRQWKSVADRNAAALNRELDETRRQMQELYQQQQQLARQHLPPEEQTNFELGQARREIERLQVEIQKERGQQQAWNMLYRIAQANPGTDVQELADAFFAKGLDADSVWEMAARKSHAANQAQQKAAAPTPAPKAPKVDTGTGRPRVSGDIEEQLRNAKSARDVARLLIPQE